MIYTYRDIIQLLSNDWDMNENDYDTLNWHSINVKNKPTKEELDEKINYYNNIKPLEVLREKRNELLDKTDKYMISDFAYPSEQVKQNWITYRQELRDLPENSSPQINIIERIETNNETLISQTVTVIELENVTWPTPPS
tara:strand:+ start:458 stop:877 length:420 start_codon:yes stop_codon:yes gene_type:complete